MLHVLRKPWEPPADALEISDRQDWLEKMLEARQLRRAITQAEVRALRRERPA